MCRTLRPVGELYRVATLRALGYKVLDADAARLSVYQWQRINVHGHYSFALPDRGGGRRPLRDPDAGQEVSGG
jgi:hypothetical protein